MKREDVAYLFGRKTCTIDEKVFENLETLRYRLEEAETLKTRLGTWQFYTRQEELPADSLESAVEPGADVVAMYYRNNEPTNLFCGRVGNLEVARKDANALSRNILEQRAPLRWIYGDRGAANTFVACCLALAGYALYHLIKQTPPEVAGPRIAIAAVSAVLSLPSGEFLSRLADKLRASSVSGEYYYAFDARAELAGNAYALKQGKKKIG